MTHFLMSLGLLVLMFWSALQAQAALASALYPWRKKWLWGTSPNSTIEYLREQLMLIILDPSVRANRVQAMTAQILRLRSWRSNTMWFVFSFVAMSFWLILGFLFLRFSGLYLLTIGGGLLFIANLWGKGRDLSLVVLYVGLFLFAGEQWLRVSAGFGFGSEMTFFTQWTSDGRGFASLSFLFVGCFLGLILRMEGLSFILALVGLSSGVLSLNGAVMLWAGERAGMTMIELYVSRAWPLGVQKMLRGSAAVSLIGMFMGWLVLGFFRDIQLDSVGAQLSGLQSVVRIELFLILSVLVEVPGALMALIWGHQLGKKQPEDAMHPVVLDKKWFQQFGLRTATVKMLQAGLQGRIAEINELRNEFENRNWKDVPVFIQKGSEAELKSLSQSLAAMEADLLSRSEFFSHQWR